MRFKRGFIQSIRRVCVTAIIFVVFTLGYSFLTGLSHPTGVHHVRITEESWSDIALHIMFGIATGVVTWSWDLGLALVMFTVLMDADHLPAFFGFPVEARLAHSFLFVIMGTGFFHVVRKYSLARRGSEWLVFPAVLVHLSVDTFYTREGFPLFVPFTFESFNIPENAWILLELVALSITYLVGRRVSKAAEPKSEIDQSYISQRRSKVGETTRRVLE